MPGFCSRKVRQVIVYVLAVGPRRDKEIYRAASEKIKK